MTCSQCGRSTPDGFRPCPFCGFQPAAAGDADATGIGTVLHQDDEATGFPAADDPDATRPGSMTPDGAAPDAGADATRLREPAPWTRRQVDAAVRATAGGAAAGDPAANLVGRPLGTRYEVRQLLGAGGMGAVYAAWDRDLGVVVALKTVRPEIAEDPASARELERRFKQELLLARQVTHKNIVRVHDMGEVDGIKYITMPYLEGEDLATILKREGRLPVRRVLSIARQVASGLAAAHEAGVVHRDLKPANIMIQPNGDALVMDFGVALSTGRKSLVPAGPDGGIRVVQSAGRTMAGSVVGTIEYMAPEQARGEAVDQRADIYAFGLILYDLLLGRRRSARTGSVIDELNLRMKEPPPSPRAVDDDVPEGLDRIVSRCIQTDVTGRYPTMADVIADLDKLDENGNPLPVARRFTWGMGAAAAAAVVSLVVLTWWLSRSPAAPVSHEPVSVMIADFENATGDPAFDRTLEPILKLALEGAGFISAYDRNAMRRSLGVAAPEKLDEQTATQIAVKQGLGVVVSGSVEQRGSRYEVSIKAAQAVTGNEIIRESERASSRDAVLGVATTLAASVREALGDDTSDSAQRFAMETLSATSLEVVREYAAAMEALSRSRFEDARQRFSRAVTLDPNFGLAYAGLAIASRNLDKQQDAEKYVKEALRHLDGMTEREVYRTRGLFYYLTNDYQACVKEYGDLIARYSADAAARNNLALCQTYLRKMPEAVEEMRQVVKILPNRALYRENLALYANYSGDFHSAEQEVRAMPAPGLFGLIALAFAQMGQGQVAQAAQTYQSMGKVDVQGASYTASGLADIAVLEGRFSDAVVILTRGAEADLVSGDPDRAAAKFAALAHAQLRRGERARAIAAAERAVSISQAVKIRFLAARVLIEAGATARGKALAAGLGSELQAEPQAYAKIIEAMVALEAKDARAAVQILTEANRLLDTWIGHFELGRAYLAAGAFPQADSEFERCIKRRGEALALFLDEEPTYRFFAPVHYYGGRVKEGLGSARYQDAYRAYLAIRGKSTEDPLVPELRRRLAERP